MGLDEEGLFKVVVRREKSWIEPLDMTDLDDGSLGFGGFQDPIGGLQTRGHRLFDQDVQTLLEGRHGNRLVFHRWDSDDYRIGGIQQGVETIVGSDVQLTLDLCRTFRPLLEEPSHLDAGYVPEDACVMKTQTARTDDSDP
jgi:hypothetical protein